MIDSISKAVCRKKNYAVSPIGKLSSTTAETFTDCVATTDIIVVKDMSMDKFVCPVRVAHYGRDINFARNTLEKVYTN